MNRRDDSSALSALLQRMRDLTRRRIARQTDFTIVSALLTAVLTVTFLADLLVGHPHIQRTPTMFWLISFLVLTLIPLRAGRRYPRWAGLVVVGYLSLWSAYFITLTHHAHTELNALLEVSMVALYLGWFYRPWIARGALAFNLIAVVGALMFRTGSVTHVFSSTIAFVYAVFISVFCLEAGSYLRRRALRRASIDPLTGVLNRRGLIERGSKIIARAHRAGTPLTVAVVDFDDFKAVNDAGGHAAGDEALRATADAWVQGLSRGDLVARIGGDEFALVIHADGESANARLAEIASGAPYSWTWGLTQLRRGDDLGDLLSRADVRMYRAKGERECGERA